LGKNTPPGHGFVNVSPLENKYSDGFWKMVYGEKDGYWEGKEEWEIRGKEKSYYFLLFKTSSRDLV